MAFKNSTIFRVSEVNRKVVEILERELQSLQVRGEVSNFVSHTSGHWYFSLKEEESQIRAVMFRGRNSSLTFVPKNGDEVFVRGRVGAYIQRGTYQILCDSMELSGSGLLQKKFEELKERLKNEGVFEKAQEIPKFPKHIAIITSPTGAAIQDLLQVFKRRPQGSKITLIPALVQGAEAPESLTQALSQGVRLEGVDLIILARGGGSIEDLWAFNEESLARAIYHCPIPVISAVGHEIDFTISDFVADLRASTPSVAAEMVVQERDAIVRRSNELQNLLLQTVRGQLNRFLQRITFLQSQLPHPRRTLESLSQRTDELSEHLQALVRKNFEQAQGEVDHFYQLLQSLNPKEVMKRGFSLVTHPDGRVVRDSKNLQIKDTLLLELFKGRAQVRVLERESHGV